MANLTKKEKHIVEMYVRYFGTVATEEQIKSFDGVKSLSKITADIRKDADNSKIGITSTEFLNDVFQNLFGRDANPKDLKYVKTIDNNKNLPIATIIKNGSRDDKAVYNTKKLVAQMVAAEGGSYELANINQDNYLSIYNAKKGLLVSTVADLEAKISNVPDIINGKTYTLNTGVDTLVGTAKNDMFLATDAKNQFSIADSIDGGKGVDTLKLIDNAAITLALPTAATVKNVEILDLISGGAVTADSTSFAGVTHLYTTSTGANSSTAAATTNINATATNGGITVNGGKDVTVVSKANTTDNIAVGGATTAAAGKVSVTSTGGTANNDAQGTITVAGGTEITVNQYAGNAAATGVDTDGGNITVAGNASTTTVTVNQTAFGTGFTATATAAGVVGYTAGTVTIADANAASTTDAGTITTVTLKNYDDSTIDSGALTTVNLEGTAGTLGITAGNLTTAKVDTLGLNLNGVVDTALSTTGSDNTITVDAVYKTLNIKSSTTASTLTDLIAAGATTINVSGDAALTLTDNTFAAAKDIVVTNTAGVTIGNALATDVTFTGGAGADSIILSASYTKAINMGAGDDIVVYAAAGAGGSLNGGDGNDTLVVSAASAIAGLPEVSGFETLRAVGSATHNAHTFKALEVGAGTNTFTNVAAGVGLTVLANATSTTVTLANATGTADVFDLTLKSAANLTAGTVALAGVETININSVDTDTSTASGLNANTLTLSATAAKSIVVTGNTDLTLTNTTEILVTSFDASTATGDIIYTSANTTVGEIVTIKGGAGDDILTGSATANDTIIGGAGDDTLVYTGRADTFTGGAGDDTFEINALGTKALHLTITDLTKGDIIDIAGIDTGAATWNNAKVALGASATFDEYLDAASAGNGGTNSIARWFQFEGNTYLVNDNTAGATFAVTDAVVKITGLVDLGTSTLSGTDLTIA